MLGYCAGVVVFTLLIISKITFSWVLINKKKVALSVLTIVTSELLIVLVIYISIDKFGLSGIRILTGFILAMALSLTAFVVKKLLEKPVTD